MDHQDNTARRGKSRIRTMFETSTSPRIREGIERAHKERGDAIRKAFRWMIFRHL
jgi:hypothetical protein